MPRITPLNPRKRRRAIQRAIAVLALLLAAGGMYYLLANHYNEEGLYRNSENLLRQGRHKEASRVLEELLLRYPKGEFHPMALMDAANAYNFYLRNIPRAIELYKKATEEGELSEDKKLEAKERLAEIYNQDVGDLEQALSEYKALRIQQTDPKQRIKSTFQIAGIYLRQSHFEKALQEFEDVAKFKGDNELREKSLLKIGTIHLFLGNYTEAEGPLVEVNRSAKSEEVRQQARLGLVDVWESMEKYDRALEVLKSMSGGAEVETFKLEEQKRIREKAGILKNKSSSPWTIRKTKHPAKEGQ
jgi:tetratricopeptide (TPR) repeat protein